MAILSTLLELVPLGVIAVRRTGQVLIVNSYGRSILDASADLAIRGGCLAASSAAYDRALHTAIESAAFNAALAPAGFHIVRPRRRPLSVVISPIGRSRAGALAPDSQHRALVLLSDPELQPPASLDLLAATFDFTPAESAIAAHILTGADIADTAAALRLSGHTVRNHLKRLFSKTNTRRHSELLHTLLRSPAALRFHSAPHADVLRPDAPEAPNASASTRLGK